MTKTHEAVTAIIVKGTVPADATLVTDDNDNTVVLLADGRIAEPFLAWSFTAGGKLPVHGVPPTAMLEDDTDDICGPSPTLPDGTLGPSPVLAQRPDGFSFNNYVVQTIQLRPD